MTRGIVSARRHPGGGYSCGPARDQPCFSASGDFTVTAWAPRAALSLSGSRGGSTPVVNAGDWYNFAVIITPNQIAGQGVPRYVQSWRFVEDGTGRVVDPGCGTSTTCGFGPPRSGRMRVSAWVNADSLTAEFPIQLGPVGLTLTPSRSSVAAGDSVTFTPAGTPAGAPVEVLSWSWQPDSGAVVTVCGTNPTCTMAVPRGGTMKVSARVQGVTVAATAPVTVVPCPTGEPLLDQPKVREGLRAAWDSSNAGDPDRSKRIERAVYFYDSAGTVVYRVVPSLTTDTLCSNGPPEPSPPPGRLIADAHVHPFKLNESLPPACLPNQPMVSGYYAKGFGGPSAADWARASGGHQPPVPVLIVDRDNLYRANPMPTDSAHFEWYTPPGDSVQTSRPRKNAWKPFVREEKRVANGCRRV